MLKIKDNVDLNILEKYGFKKYEYGEYSSFHQTKKENAEIIIEKDRYISINPYGENDIIKNSLLDILYDLIKADLVVKVEDEINDRRKQKII